MKKVIFFSFVSYTVKEFVEEAFKYVDIKIGWKGKGLKEVGYNKKNGNVLYHANEKTQKYNVGKIFWYNFFLYL